MDIMLVGWYTMGMANLKSVQTCQGILLPMSTGQGGSGIIWNISILLSGYVAPHPRRQQSSYKFTNCSYALKVKYIQGYKQTWVLLFETCKTDHKSMSKTFIYHTQKQNRVSLHLQARELGQQRHKYNKVNKIIEWVQHNIRNLFNKQSLLNLTFRGLCVVI